MQKVLEPEVAGELGQETTMDTSIHPPIVKKVHFEFSGWLGDDLLESFPCFIVTQRLKEEIEKCNLTGFVFEDIKVTTSYNFQQFYPLVELPKFYWANMADNNAGNDFSLTADYKLVVSNAAFVLLNKFNIKNALIYDVENLN